ncbi:hypothetical protein HGRIS_012803 [Hohenbuehelia grisea]|uniref:Condensation domain-containing protein n=1 Tax=Hohenbuehelia grisea TaxID=104357 RepID=A0ABR3ITR5_9AGAR
MTWRLQQSTPSSSRVFERRLGYTELSFYYDSLPYGTSDSARHHIVHALGERGIETFSLENVSRAWTEIKQYYPLIGAHVQMDSEGEGGSFIVREDDLRACLPGEVNRGLVSSLNAVDELLQQIVHGRRRLNGQLLAQLYVLERTDIAGHFHVVFHVAHIITDGMSNINLANRFFDSLCSPLAPAELEDRLAIALPTEILDPMVRLPIARQRWLRAISYAIREVRWAKLKGGHTLPLMSHPPGFLETPKSFNAVLSLEPDVSQKIIANCRAQGVTFGHAYSVIAQVAMTRLLCRRYAMGSMSREEWEHRTRQPMITGGPLNLRPFLDKQWIDKGGLNNVGCAISFFWYILPFMPLGSAVTLAVGDGVPSYITLLSKQRFFHRARLVKKQADHVFKHPIFVGIATEHARYRIQRVKEVAERYTERQAAPQAPTLPPSHVLSFVASSMGNVGLFLRGCSSLADLVLASD